MASFPIVFLFAFFFFYVRWGGRGLVYGIPQMRGRLGTFAFVLLGHRF